METSMMNNIPEEVELMVNELVRTCMKHNVALTGFAFDAGERPFVFHFGNIKDTGEALREVHETLLSYVDRPEAMRKTLYKNDA